MRGRGVPREFFLGGVRVAPGDGAQPTGDRRAGTAAGFQLLAGSLAAGAAGREKRQRPGLAPAGELAQVQRAGLTRQAAVSGQEPGERGPLGAG